MGKLTPEIYSREQLARALMAAGIKGVSKMRKDELAVLCKKLSGKARENMLSALPESARAAAPAAKLVPKPGKAAKAPAKKATVTKTRAPVKSRKAAKPVAVAPSPEPKAVEALGEYPVQIPPPGDYPLPDSYGIDLFHVLVFDPYGAYVFWELSPQLLTELYREYGEEMWRVRRLAVRVTSTSGRQFTQELYGDRNSYFLNVREPGENVKFELGFLFGADFRLIAPTRLVAFPRDRESSETAVRMLEVRILEAKVTVRELSRKEVAERSVEQLEGHEYETGLGNAPSSSERLSSGDGS
jgi:hypothetical protein